MFAKSKKLFGLFLVASTVMPYVLSTNAGVKNFIARYWPAKSAATEPAEHPLEETAAAPLAALPEQSAATEEKRPPKLPTKQAVHPIEEVLRFDVTLNWVLATWPRVSASLSELDLQGYRVPLVTGTTDEDIAGSLTYYFNPDQRVARITFFGTTGDARRLVALLESRFAFKREIVPEANLFVYQVKSWSWGTKVESEARIRPAKVVRSDTPRARFEVALLIDRPKSMD